LIDRPHSVWFFIPMPPAVADTSLLVAFSAIERLDVLCGVFPGITIPAAVLNELEAGDWKEASAVLREIRAGTWIRVVPVPAFSFPIVPPANLGAGELEVLRLASYANTTALIDDSAACRFAERIGVPVVRSLAILARAKYLGSIQAVRPLVEGMVDHGIRLSPDLVSRFLKGLGES
jgi:predicted nucleic acid-binding protein